MPAQPSNVNFLSGFGFSLEVKNLPNVDYFIQKISVPGLTLGQANQPTPLAFPVPYPGDLTFNDLVMTFKIDEALKSYTEIWNWMTLLGSPSTFSQYATILQKDQDINPGPGATMSPATLTIYNNKYNPIFRINFMDIWPSSLSDINFDATSADVTYLTADVTFKYTLYTIEKLP